MIYRGVEADVPGINLHHVEETSDLLMDSLPDYAQRQVRDGIGASSLDDARTVVSNLQRLVPCPEPATPSPSASPSKQSSKKASAKAGGKATAKPTRKRTPSRTPSATPSPSPSPSAGSGLCTEAP